MMDVTNDESHEENVQTAQSIDTVLEDLANHVQQTDDEDEEYDEDDLKDPSCDPDRPIKVQFQEISAAAFKIKNGIERTPCDRSRLSEQLGMELYLKKDFMQYTGSFKERGARYALMCLTPEQQKLGVITASAGNHALGLAYHGSKLNIPVIVVMPKTAPLMKQELCKQLGANVVVHGQDFGESKNYAIYISKKHGLMYINGYDHPNIIAGQGTMGIEIVEQVPDVDAVVVPVGGGGLIAGVALAVKSLKPSVKIFGVESERSPGMSVALKAGHPTYTKVLPTLADGLSIPVVGVNAFETLKPLIDRMLVIQEEFIALSILRLVEMEKCVVEGAGATGLAGILSDSMPELKGKKVVCVVCGGNIDTTVLGRVLERGLATDGRLCRFVVTVSDRPGGIAQLTRLISSIGVSLKDIFHERAWLKSDIYSVNVKCIVETRNQEHCIELEQLLRQNYDYVNFGNSHSVFL
ncbi:hypothetical protein HELRODRAFT_185307 [Helobdella robusta]|uniref:L-serine deaminase n=1 Tax=Helobdella robusta TaxID=6412 RepID=T1FMN2_HELRO|nr:hypothetical protein HELRODRAFT_185307 [Helobdella robusta]ESO09945.1 hypothetical protein HELRODRAFT_185307 [Helobdella robusta]